MPAKRKPAKRKPKKQIGAGFLSSMLGFGKRVVKRKVVKRKPQRGGKMLTGIQSGIPPFYTLAPTKPPLSW